MKLNEIKIELEKHVTDLRLEKDKAQKAYDELDAVCSDVEEALNAVEDAVEALKHVTNE